MTPTDQTLDDIWREVGRLFRQIDLTPEEKRWIEENASALNEYAINLFASNPASVHLRSLVIAYAVAQVYGPGEGIDVLKEIAVKSPPPKIPATE